MRKFILAGMLVPGVSSEQQLITMKEVGWDGFFNEIMSDLTFRGFSEVAKREGLIHQSFHAPFDCAADMWDDNESGNAEVARQINFLRECAELNVPIMVIHAIIGMDKHTPNDLGVERFGKIFAEAEKLGITVALENTEGEEYLERLLRAYKNNKYVKFCIDTGHEMCVNGRRDLIGKYGDRLICTHLNDNMGQTGEMITWWDDSHMLPFDGTADWQNIADRLNKVGYKGDLTFEFIFRSRPNRDTHKIYAGLDYRQYITLALEKAKKFAEMLDK